MLSRESMNPWNPRPEPETTLAGLLVAARPPFAEGAGGGGIAARSRASLNRTQTALVITSSITEQWAATMAQTKQATNGTYHHSDRSRSVRAR